VSEKSLPGVDPAAKRDTSTLDRMESLDASGHERSERHHREFMERLDRLAAAVEALARAAGTGRHEGAGSPLRAERPTARHMSPPGRPVLDSGLCQGAG
jgi:hypothetical protein